MNTARPPFNPQKTALLIAMVQLICTAIAFAQGLHFNRLGTMGNWDGIWQTVPSIDLLNHPIKSIWNLHANPPLYSMLGAVILNAVGPKGLPIVMQILNLLAGGVTVAMAFALFWRLTHSPRWSIGVGLVIALHPALVYYQAHMIYEMWVVLLVTASALLLHRALERRRLRDLAAWLAVLVALVMLRSLYHLLFLLVAMLFAWPAWRAIASSRRGVALTVLLVAVTLVLPAGWYAKNKIQYGFFGASSWMGIGWFKVVWENTTEVQRLEYAKAGLIESWQATLEPYIVRPGQYREFGFDATSDQPMLNRNDFHNINVIAISEAYQASTRRVLLDELRHSPARIAQWYGRNYGFFMRPTAGFAQLKPLRGIIPWDPVYALTTGGWVMRVLFIPVLLLGLGFAFTGRNSPRIALPSANAFTLAYLCFTCAYVLAVGTLFETGENERFRFGIEPLWIILAGYVVWWSFAPKNKTTEPAA